MTELISHVTVGVKLFCTNDKEAIFSELIFITLRATKNHNVVLGDSEDESDAKIFSDPNSETSEQLAPCIQLEMLRQS